MVIVFVSLFVVCAQVSEALVPDQLETSASPIAPVTDRLADRDVVSAPQNTSALPAAGPVCTGDTEGAHIERPVVMDVPVEVVEGTVMPLRAADLRAGMAALDSKTSDWNQRMTVRV